MKFFSRQPATPPTTLTIEGMSCSACVQHVERALLAVSGVASAQVDLAQKRALVTGSAPQEALVAAVAEAGYNATSAAQ